MESNKGRTCVNALRKYRKVRGLKEKDVAMMLGFASASRISRWEKGTCMPSATNLFRLALTYRVMADALFPDLIRSLKEELAQQEAEFLRLTSRSNDHGQGERQK